MIRRQRLKPWRLERIAGRRRERYLEAKQSKILKSQKGRLAVRAVLANTRVDMLVRPMKRAVIVLFSLSITLCFAVSLSALEPPGIDNGFNGFDDPVVKKTVDYGPSPYYPPARNKRKTLTCYYYSAFTVKEYDEGQKGAEWLSITSSPDAPCTKARGEHERVLLPEEWSGYFWGALGTYALFDAADGQDGGMGFAVFDAATGKKLFEDSTLPDFSMKAPPGVRIAFRISSGSDGIARLSYLRVVRAGCSLSKEPAECWRKVRSDFGVTQTDIPACIGYEDKDRSRESAVVYQVSVLLRDAFQIRAADGRVFCWPTD